MELMEFMDSIYSDDQYLEHHGVKGQKWGVRRAQKSSGGGKRGGSSKGVSNERVKGGVLSSLASNRKVRIAAGIAAAAIVGVAAYTIAGPQISALAARGTKMINDYLDAVNAKFAPPSNKSMPTLMEAYRHLSNPTQNSKPASALKTTGRTLASRYGVDKLSRLGNTRKAAAFKNTVFDANATKYFDKDNPGRFGSPIEYKGRYYFDKDSSSAPYGYNDRRKKK